jgi:hypothetical protein
MVWGNLCLEYASAKSSGKSHDVYDVRHQVTKHAQ